MDSKITTVIGSEGTEAVVRDDDRDHDPDHGDSEILLLSWFLTWFLDLTHWVPEYLDYCTVWNKASKV